MHSLIGRLADYCVDKQIISPAQSSWFIYGLEKRLATVMVGIPFLLLAVIMSNIPCAVSFFAAYFFVRKYTGGFHANTVLGCLLFSLLFEVLLLAIVYPILNTIVIICCVTVCVPVIYILAPYNHPNMHLTAAEIAACKKHARIRIWVIFAIVTAACVSGLAEVAKGVTLGIALASFLLCLGHIFDRRISQ